MRPYRLGLPLSLLDIVYDTHGTGIGEPGQPPVDIESPLTDVWIKEWSS